MFYRSGYWFPSIGQMEPYDTKRMAKDAERAELREQAQKNGCVFLLKKKKNEYGEYVIKAYAITDAGHVRYPDEDCFCETWEEAMKTLKSLLKV